APSLLMSITPARARRFSTLLHTIAIAAIAIVAACGGKDARQADGGAGGNGSAKGGAPLRVALLTPGPIPDQSWNAGAYAGLMRIKDSLGAQVSHIQTKTPADFEENFRQYGAQGYDLVFGHGFEF